jgi:STAS domain
MRYKPRDGSAPGPAGEPGTLTMSPLTGRAGLRLDGEADLTSQDELQKALAALPPCASEIHFELAGLKFIDVAAARALMARALHPPHARLILHHPPPSLQRLIDLLWNDSNAQFRFCPDSRFEDEPAAAQAGRVKPSLPSSATDASAAVSLPSVSRTDLADSPVPAVPPRGRAGPCAPAASSGGLGGA